MVTPDNWIIIKLPEDKGHKILAGWSGGYLHGNSWRLNSGIESYEEHDDYIDFKGYSGSIYRCFKSRETVRFNVMGVLNTLIEHGAEQIDYEDFKKIV